MGGGARVLLVPLPPPCFFVRSGRPGGGVVGECQLRHKVRNVIIAAVVWRDVLLSVIRGRSESSNFCMSREGPGFSTSGGTHRAEMAAGSDCSSLESTFRHYDL